MLQLVYFGRLDKEKGLGSIIMMIDHFSHISKDKTLPFILHVFGDGEYNKQITDLALQFPQHILYYGFQPLQHIKKIAEQCDYCLMPSLFLETFGLSAVNALSRGLPVIGYRQGGLTPFIIDDYNLLSIPGSPRVQLVAMMDKLLTKGNHDDSKKCHDIAKKYSKDARMHNFNKICHFEGSEAKSRNLLNQGDPSTTVGMTSEGGQKILLVTDFINKLGGIESYVYDVAKILKEYGYDVAVIGGKGGRTKIGRIISMFFSAYNIVFNYRLQKKIEAFEPDLIRCHSVLRNAGRLPLRTINASSATTRMMYHDLGYFHPFPHTVTDAQQIPSSLSWKDFSVSVHSPMKKIFVRGKLVLLQLIQKELQSFDLHLAPSTFMKRHIENNYTKDTCEIFPHFIQE